jgi:hypothetical protein
VLRAARSSSPNLEGWDFAEILVLNQSESRMLLIVLVALANVPLPAASCPSAGVTECKPKSFT